MITIGPHSPIAGTRDFDEPPANEHGEREHEPCPRCGGRKSAHSRVGVPGMQQLRGTARQAAVPAIRGVVAKEESMIQSDWFGNTND